MTRTAAFPDDDNGDVLRRMEDHGDNLAVPRNNNFEHIFPSVEAALAFAALAINRTDMVSVSWYEEQACWNVRVTRHMVPTHQNITELELSLDHLARNHGGKADGWGCLQIDESDS